MIDRASAIGDNSPALRVFAPYVRLEGFRITNSDPDRSPTSPISGKVTPWRGAGIYGRANHLSVRNMIIDNNGHGVLCHTSGLELYGNQFLFNGNNNLEHSFYGGANGANLPNRIEDNLFIGSAGENLHIWPSSSTDPVQNFFIAGNVCVAAGMIGPRERTTENLLVSRRYTSLFDNITIANNVVFVPASYPSPLQYGIRAGKKGAENRRLVLRNNLVVAGVPTKTVAELPMGINTFLRHSDLHAAEPQVLLRPNRYAPGNARIAILNRSRAKAIAVDLPRVLSVGDAYEVVDAFNPFATPVAGGVWNGTAVLLPMVGPRNPVTVGKTASPAAHTAPEFGVFLVRRTRSAPTRTPARKLGPKSVRASVPLSQPGHP